jgi:hypothetical protein
MAARKLLLGSLPDDAVILDGDGVPTRQLVLHNRWVVASQDCDLDCTDVTEVMPTIELHPVLRQEAPRNPDWGIRSRLLLLAAADEYVVSPSPHTLLAAAVLTDAVQRGQGPTPVFAVCRASR